MKTSPWIFAFSQRKYLPLISAAILVIVSQTMNGQSPPLKSHPSVGLVLSGGAAHGIAHIGVLKVMEEAGLRPDCITGVSMGALIGGLYATGYSADSIWHLLENTDWDHVFSNTIPENKVIFPEKANYNNSIASFPVSTRKITLPQGLINGQAAENALSYYLWQAALVKDFSELPIPFLCVATDLISYKKVILRSGYLPDAIRASVTVPTIFTLFKMDTLLLADGGILRNFAAGEARDMGADIIIGSYTGFSAFNGNELGNVSGIMRQITLFRSLEDYRSQTNIINYRIEPQVQDLPLTGFNNTDLLVMRGYQEAAPYREIFRKLADSIKALRVEEHVSTLPKNPKYRFDRIIITGNKRYTDEQISGVLAISPGEITGKERITEAIELLYGKMWFEKVKYRIIPRHDSLLLELDCIEKPPAILDGAIYYDNSVRSGIKLCLSVKNLITKRSVINIRSMIGQYLKFDFSALQYVDRNEKFGVSVDLKSDKTPVPMLHIFDKDGLVTSRNFTGGFSLSNRIGLNHQMDASIMYDYRGLLPRFGNEHLIKSITYNYLTTSFSYRANTLDEKYFPGKGTDLTMTFSSSSFLSVNTKFPSGTDDQSDVPVFIFPKNRFYTINARLMQYFSLSKKVTVGTGGCFVWVSDCDSVLAHNNFFLLGGAFSTSKRTISAAGLHPNQIAVRQAGVINLKSDIRLSNDLHLEIMADGVAYQEAGRNYNIKMMIGAGTGIGYMSALGPVRTGVMFTTGKDIFFSKIKAYFSFGYNF